MNRLRQRTILEGSRLSRMLTRKAKMPVAIARANKMTRQIWDFQRASMNHTKQRVMVGKATRMMTRIMSVMTKGRAPL